MASSMSEDSEMQDVQQYASSENDRTGQLVEGTGNAISEGDVVLGMKLPAKILRETFTCILQKQMMVNGLGSGDNQSFRCIHDRL